MPYEILFMAQVMDDIAELRAFDRVRVLDKIEEQLRHQPTVPTRNRKILIGLNPPWRHLQPVWELRIGDFRVFYDVNEDEQRVYVRALRRKFPGQTTEDIL